jgi:hypothetical protein
VNEILRYLVDYMAFIWGTHRYRISDSRVFESFGDAWLDISSDAVRLRFMRDRGQLFLDVQPVSAAGDRERYSIDVVRRHLTGQVPASGALLDADHGAFLQENFAAIENLVADHENWPATAAELERLLRLQSKERFG